MVLSQSKVFLVTFMILSISSLNILFSEKVNLKCPVLLEESSEPNHKIIYKKNELFFCCKKCLKKFKNNPAKYEKHISYGQKVNKPKPNEIGHDHHKDHLQSNQWTLSMIGKIHPLLVHFPIAGIFFAFLLQMTEFLFRPKDFRIPILVILILSCLFFVASTVSGWNKVGSGHFSSSEFELIFWHRLLAIISGILVFFTTALYFKCNNSKNKMYGVYVLSLSISVAVTSITGHLGGLLVYGNDYFNF